MVLGKGIGWAITSAVTGTTLVTFGLGITAIAAAAVQGVILLAFLLTVGRRGERRLPWTSGDAISERRAVNSFASEVRPEGASIGLSRSESIELPTRGISVLVEKALYPRAGQPQVTHDRAPGQAGHHFHFFL